MTRFRKPFVHVYLRRNIKGVGYTGDIVLVPTESARNFLLPKGWAYYVPHLYGKPVLPDDWKPRILPEDIKVEQILPAFPLEGFDNQTIKELQTESDESQDQDFEMTKSNSRQVELEQSSVQAESTVKPSADGVVKPSADEPSLVEATKPTSR